MKIDKMKIGPSDIDQVAIVEMGVAKMNIRQSGM